MQLAVKSMIVLLCSEAIVTAAMLLLRDKEKFNFIIGSDLLPMLLLLISGMSFFERHTAFCLSNAVSVKNRLISLTVTSAVIILPLTVTDCTARGIIGDGGITLAELLRTTAHARMISGGNILADIFEMFFLGTAVFYIGYFLGGLRCSKGRPAVIILMAIITAVMFGSVFLDEYMDFTPAMALLYLPSLMEKSVPAAVLLNIIIAAVSVLAAFRLSENAQGAEEE